MSHRETGNQDICVSVIIPVYNVENYLKACLQSVQKQNIEEIEIMHNTKSHGKHLLCFEKMADISLCIPSAYGTVTCIVYGCVVQLILGIHKIKFESVCIYMGVASVSCRKNTVRNQRLFQHFQECFQVCLHP